MAITSADVLLIAPELSTISAGQWTAILNDVALQVSSAYWGTRFDLGSKYLAAHLATLTKRAGAAGQVASMAVGGVSVSYTSDSMTGDGLKTTSYGQEYDRLSKMNYKARFAVT